MSASTPIRIGDYVVENHYLRFVEAELRRHPHRKRRLRQIEKDILFGTSEDDRVGMPRGTDTSQPTQNRGIALALNREYQHLLLMVQNVEDVLNDLPDHQQKLVRHWYFERTMKWDDMLKVLGMGERTFYRHRTQVLLAFVLTLVGDHAVQAWQNNGRHEGD